MLSKQEFLTKYGIISLRRDRELCTIRLDEKEITLTVDEYQELFNTLRNSPFIFSKANV